VYVRRIPGRFVAEVRRTRCVAARAPSLPRENRERTNRFKITGRPRENERLGRTAGVATAALRAGVVLSGVNFRRDVFRGDFCVLFAPSLVRWRRPAQRVVGVRQTGALVLPFTVRTGRI